MRSYWKGPFVDSNLLKRIAVKLRKQPYHKHTFLTRSRSSVVLDCFNNLVIAVHNGNSYYYIKMKADYVGYKLGELVYTKKTAVFKKKRNKKKKNFRK
jgi:ribosomal protein S19